MRERDRLAAAALLSLTCAACPPSLKPQDAGPRPGPETVALVGGKQVTLGDLADRISIFSDEVQQRYFTLQDEQRRLLAQVIEEEQLLAVARHRKLDRDPRFLQVMRRHLVTLVKEDIYKEVTLEGLTDAEVQAYYEGHKADFTPPPRLRASHILIADEQQAKEVARKALGLSDGEFARLARAHTTDAATRAAGGDLGWFTSATPSVPQRVFEVVQKLPKVGDVTIPIRSPRGWHIVRLTGREVGPPRPLKQVLLQVKLAAFRDKRDRVYAGFLRELRKRVPVQRFPDRLERLKSYRR